MEKFGGNSKQESAEKSSISFERVRRALMQTLLGAAAYSAVMAIEVPSAEAMDLQPRAVHTEILTKAAIQKQAQAPTLSPEQAFNAAKERILDDTISVTKNAIAQKSVQDALRWKGRDPVSSLLHAVELPILPALLDGTKYDVSELKRKYPVQMGREALNKNGMTVLGESKLMPSTIPEATRASYLGSNFDQGNGFYFGDTQTIVTNEHVAKFFVENTSILRNDSLDISVAKVSKRFAAVPEQVVHDEGVKDEEIEGSLVSIVGKDPDGLSDPDGGKVFPGVAVKLTPEFAEGLLAGVLSKQVTPAGRAEIERVTSLIGNSYMIVLPPGEARKIFPKEAGETPVKGMSGSPVFGHIRGKYQIVGIMWGAHDLVDTTRGREVDVGYFFPISAIRTIAAHAKRWELN